MRNRTASRTVDIPDENLRAVIERYLGKESGDPITEAEMATLTEFYARSASISDLTGLEFATNLKSLNLQANLISDISALSCLHNLTRLDISDNLVSDLSALSGLTKLESLDPRANLISDAIHILILQSRGVKVHFDKPTPQTLLKISGDNQKIIPGLILAAPFVVEVQDRNGAAFKSVPVRFTVTKGSGTLSVENAETDTNGRAQSTLILDKNQPRRGPLQLFFFESTLTLGSNLGTYAVEVTVAEIRQTQTFTATVLASLVNLPAWIHKLLARLKIKVKSPLVDFPDPNLRAEIEKVLGKESDATITETEMATLTSFNIHNTNITLLNGLEFATNLKSLYLSDNRISDLSILSGLTNLTELHISRCTISNLPALSRLTNLTELHISRCAISNLPALSRLTNLTELHISRCAISNLSALSGLTNLTELYLSYNSISDLSALSDLTSLTSLYLSDNSISDLSALSDLINLTELYLSYNSISDLSALSDLINLTELYLSNNSISDLSVLSDLINLTELYLSYNFVSDLSVLSDLINLTELDLERNWISDLSVLSDLTSLTSLYLSDNSISDLSALSGLTKLRTLWLGTNPLSYRSINTHIPTLKGKGGLLDFDDLNFNDRTPQTLVKISGDNRTGPSGTALANPFIVEVRDQNGEAFEGVPVTFTVIVGDGTLSVENTETDADGRARSTLTRGPDAGMNTVEVTVEGIEQTRIFTAHGFNY